MVVTQDGINDENFQDVSVQLYNERLNYLEEQNDKKGRGKQSRFLTFDEICLSSGFHPETVYSYIVENKLEREEEIIQKKKV